MEPSIIPVTWSKHIWSDEYPLCEPSLRSMAAYTTLFEFPFSQMNPPLLLPPSMLPAGLELLNMYSVINYVKEHALGLPVWVMCFSRLKQKLVSIYISKPFVFVALCL